MSYNVNKWTPDSPLGNERTLPLHEVMMTQQTIYRPQRSLQICVQRTVSSHPHLAT